MRLILAASVFALSAAVAGAAGAAPRNLSGFTSVSANAGTEVEVVIGPNFSVDVSGSDADRIITRVADGKLIVEPRRGVSFRGRRDARVRVTMPSVEGLEAASGASLRASGVNGGALVLDVSSGANLNVAGACASFTADVSSGANLRSEGMRCENGSVDVSSGGNAQVFASGRLNVDASSGGLVILHGGGGLGDVDTSSGGSVRRAG